MNNDLKRYMQILESVQEEPKGFKSAIPEEEQIEEIQEVSLSEQLEAMMEMDYHEDLADVQNSLNNAVDLIKVPVVLFDRLEDYMEQLERAQDFLSHARNDVEIPSNPEEAAMKAKIDYAGNALANAHNQIRTIFDNLRTVAMSVDSDLTGNQ